MAGTLSAVVYVFAPQAVAAGFSAGGALDTGGFMPIVPLAVPLAAEGSFTPAVAIASSAGAPLFGAGVMAATFSQIYQTPTAAKQLKATGVLTSNPAAYNNFTPYNDTIGRATTNVPIGTTGCYVTLTGPGGRGGNGYSATVGTTKGGGAGGGGGGRVLRSFIPRSQLGTTYSCHEGSVAGGDASTFTSGGKTVSANPGGDGASGGTTNAGGAGGTVTTGGFTGLTTQTGGVGGAGGSSGPINGNPGSSVGGGGAGGVGNAFGTTANAGSAGSSPGGGGGTGNVSTAGTGGTSGGNPGGGGGGGGGGNPGGGGAFGANGDLLIEWV